jgi:hypothetical protein
MHQEKDKIFLETFSILFLGLKTLDIFLMGPPLAFQSFDQLFDLFITLLKVVKVSKVHKQLKRCCLFPDVRIDLFLGNGKDQADMCGSWIQIHVDMCLNLNLVILVSLLGNCTGLGNLHGLQVQVPPGTGLGTARYRSGYHQV